MAGSLILDLLDDQLVCSIHQDMIENPRELPCRHTFCRGCIERITERHNGQARVQCPSCRKHTILPFEGVAALPVPQDIQRLLNTRNGLLRDSNPRRSPEQIREWFNTSPSDDHTNTPHNPLPISRRENNSFGDSYRTHAHQYSDYMDSPALMPHMPVLSREPHCQPVRRSLLQELDDDCPHKRTETWYTSCQRSDAARLLKGRRNGTFLMRPAGQVKTTKDGALHTNSIDVVFNGVKHLRVLKYHNMYGFNIKNCTYPSLMDLVLYYSEHSLDTHNPSLTTYLSFPVNS